MVDVDHPCIESVQTLLLLSQAFLGYGLGKKAYMTFSNCAAMVIALDLYRESPAEISLADWELRRRLFWTSYITDRFMTCDSNRPCLLSDHAIILRLPSSDSLTGEGDLFHVGANTQSRSTAHQSGINPCTLLIDITRILGIATRYLATGGAKADSHPPWHALSTLSKIGQELDAWTASARDTCLFSPLGALFGHPESTTLLLSKLIYHLVHCLLYRAFLPIDLVELRGSGQHQSWQIRVTNLCFVHANAIAELVGLASTAGAGCSVEWPDFVGHCLFVAGTVHVHGVFYHKTDSNGDNDGVFSSSAEFLAREMAVLSWLRGFWAGLQWQREMLQTIYDCHAELVRSGGKGSRSSVFPLERFLDRYPVRLDGEYVRVTVGDGRVPAFPFPFPFPFPCPCPPDSRPCPTSACALTASARLANELHAIDGSNADANASPLSCGYPPQTLFDIRVAGLTANAHPHASAHPQYATFPFESTSREGNGSGSGSGFAPAPSESAETEPDPFLSLLEELVEHGLESAHSPIGKLGLLEPLA